MLPRMVEAARAGVELRAGHPELARDHLLGALPEVAELSWDMATGVLDTAAMALTRLGWDRPAARLFGALDHLRDSAGAVVEPPDVTIREAAVDDTRAALGIDWEAEYSAGAGLSLGEAVDFAVEHLSG